MDARGHDARGHSLLLVFVLGLCGLPGCSTVMTNAIPAAVARGFDGGTAHIPRSPIDFTLLRQQPPPSYLVGPRDVLGIFIQDVLGRRDEPPPVFTALPPIGSTDASLLVGNPVAVSDDGTIVLPSIEPLRIAGLTIPQVDAAIHRAYTVDRKLLKAGQEQVNVTLNGQHHVPRNGHSRRLFGCRAADPQAAGRNHYFAPRHGQHHRSA